MKHFLFKCSECSVYTMDQQCPECGNTAWAVEPPRFSPQDRWGKYRRKLLLNLENDENDG